MEYNEIDIKDSYYPEKLRLIADPPKRLYCLGDTSLLDKESVGVVGSRKFSSYGRWVAENIAEILTGANFVVVSGMAAGIDSFAHRGALDFGGKTIAVLGTGLDKCYPAKNKNLKEEIARKGLLVTEYPNGYPVKKFNFPRRNRIISGLSKAVVIGEAGLNSGALITAEFAAGQGKDVYVVPGNINNSYGMGGNLLLTDGAVPLVVLRDIVKYLGRNISVVDEDIDDMSHDEIEIYKALSNCGEMSIDELSEKTEKPTFILNGLVTVMEIKGLIHTSMGKIFIAK